LPRKQWDGNYDCRQPNRNGGYRDTVFIFDPIEVGEHPCRQISLALVRLHLHMDKYVLLTTVFEKNLYQLVHETDAPGVFLRGKRVSNSLSKYTKSLEKSKICRAKTELKQGYIPCNDTV